MDLRGCRREFEESGEPGSLEPGRLSKRDRGRHIGDGNDEATLVERGLDFPSESETQIGRIEQHERTGRWNTGVGLGNCELVENPRRPPQADTRAQSTM